MFHMNTNLIFQLHDQNALQILNVQITLHAYKRDAKTLAPFLPVEPMLNVEAEIIVLCAPASEIMREIHTLFVLSVRGKDPMYL